MKKSIRVEIALQVRKEIMTSPPSLKLAQARAFFNEIVETMDAAEWLEFCKRERQELP